MATTQQPPESASPALADGLAVTVTQLYTDAETLILAAITLHTRGALRTTAPAAELTRRATVVQASVRRIIDHTERQAAREIPKTLAIAYRRGHGLDQRPLTRMGQDVLERLRSLRGGILAWVRGLLNRLTGALHSPNPAVMADRVMQQAAGRGVTVADMSGRQLGIGSYVEATVQHQAGQAAIEGFTVRVAEDGDDLVIVTESPHPCPLCMPWEHRILSVSGRDSKRPSMATARAAGLFHPRCRHTIFRWFPGFEWPPNVLHHLPGTYEAEQRQRDIERHIRNWKRRQAAALDDVTKAKATVKVRGWQAELRRHLAAEGLQRSRMRERTDFGHTPSIKHAYGKQP